MTTMFGTADLAFRMGESVSRVRLFDGPLDLSWHHCATTSDFIADLFALRFQSSRHNYREVRHSIGYLVNELIEKVEEEQRHPNAHIRNGPSKQQSADYEDKSARNHVQGIGAD